jgi:phage terminase large subunit-like protein
VAELQLRVIKENLETNLLLQEGFGRLKPDDPVKWTNSEIIVVREAGQGHPSVVALGEGTAILSRRAKYIIADDIVRDDEVQTPEQRQRLRDWIHGVLIGVLEADNQIGFIGTKKHYADYYADLEQNPKYYFRSYDAIVEEKPVTPEKPDGEWVTLWPEKWPEYRLRERLVLIGTYQFNQNYRNISMADADSPFPLAWLEKCKDVDQPNLGEYPYDDFVKKVVSVDLSLGDTHGTGSYFVAIVLALRQDGHFVMLHLFRDRLDFPSQVKKIDSLIKNFSPHAVVVESNAYQGAMTATVIADHPGLEVVPHQTGRNKNDPTEGIPMMQPLAEAGRFHFPYAPGATVLTDIMLGELNQLGVARYSDTVMALWFAVKYLSTFVIFTTGNQARAMVI